MTFRLADNVMLSKAQSPTTDIIISTEDLPAGLYIIRLLSTQGQWIEKKLIIK